MDGYIVIASFVIGLILFFLILNAIWIRQDYWALLKAVRMINTRLEKVEKLNEAKKRWTI